MKFEDVYLPNGKTIGEYFQEKDKDLYDKKIKNKIVLSFDSFLSCLGAPKDGPKMIIVIDKELYKSYPEDKTNQAIWINNRYVPIDTKLAQAIHSIYWKSYVKDIVTHNCCSGHVLNCEESFKFTVNTIELVCYEYCEKPKEEKTNGWILFKRLKDSENCEKSIQQITRFSNNEISSCKYDENKVKFFFNVNSEFERARGYSRLLWTVDTDEESIEYACKILTKFFLNEF